MTSLAQLQVQDTKEQRQCRHNARLTESGNTRSKHYSWFYRAVSWL